MTNQKSEIKKEKNNPVGFWSAWTVNLLDIIYLILVIFYLPNFLFKGKHRIGLRQRLGIYPLKIKESLKQDKPVIWLHAVSVGEVKAAIALIIKIRENFPNMHLVISTITPTGNAIAKQIANVDETIIYFPFDLSWIVNNVVAMVKPQMLIIMETEIWPNMIKQIHARNIPIIIVNGRISDKAYSRYKVLKPFFRQYISKINILCMQTEKDAQRIELLGAEKENIKVCGNIKFDQVVNSGEDNKYLVDFQKTECLILAGSTHDNEEEIIARTFSKVKLKHPNVKLLLAPRHPHRAGSISQMLKKQGLESIFLSALSDEAKENDKIFILDSMGLLNSLYEIADIVFVGGSLIAHGGQNPIEPAVWSKPIVFGKHMFNFSKIAEIFLNSNAAIMVENEQQLSEVLDDLITNKDKRLLLAEKAKEVVAQNRGSVDKIMNEIVREIQVLDKER